MTLIEIFTIIIIHWIADFIFQDEKWALGKSKNWSDLLKHTGTYSFIWLCILPFYALFNLDTYVQWSGLKFVFITFIAHTITDYFTSRIVSKKFEKEAIFDIKLNYSMFKTGDILESKSNQLKKTGETYNGNNFSIILMGENGYHDGVENFKTKRYNPIPNFGAFTIIGIDQVLHYIQLFLTYYLLTT